VRPKVLIFADFVCPWCFIGARRLDQAIASIDEAVRPEIVHQPFLLVPSTPPEGLDVRTLLRERYGSFDPVRFFGPPEAAARESGIPLTLSKQPRMYPTLAAHSLLRLADLRGVGPLLAGAIYSAQFLEAQNISQPEVLVPLARACGIAEDEAVRMTTDETELGTTRQEAENAAALGIRGVPFFLFGLRVGLTGLQTVERLKREIAAASETDSPASGDG
jgi:predicted DsbA family dithiol-disulfide isomerase